MAETLTIALEADQTPIGEGGDGVALKARSNYGAAQDGLTHLHLWLTVDHGIEVSWRGQADAVERLDRAFRKMGLEGVKRAILGRLEVLGGLESGERPQAILDLLVDAFREAS